jgi:NAD(P)-dependent dehydrogenase (short-subunit alcohol dehydrogenase family)
MTETIALVTGANKGIGREISRQLAGKGVRVLLGARDRSRGEKVVAELSGQGLPVEFLQLDVTSQPSVDESAPRPAHRGAGCRDSRTLGAFARRWPHGRRLQRCRPGSMVSILATARPDVSK